MSGNAALLIDLENFYLAREATAGGGNDDPYDVIHDLERLCGFAQGLVGRARRLIVRRAYADFMTRTTFLPIPKPQAFTSGPTVTSNAPPLSWPMRRASLRTARR